MKAFPVKDSDDRLRYYWDFSAWIADCGAIVGYDVAIESPPDEALELAGTVQGTGSYAAWVMAWVIGGTRFVTYLLRCRATFADGSVKDDVRSLTVTQ